MQGCGKSFLAVCWGVKKEVSKKNAFFVFLFDVRKRKRERMKKMEKEYFQKNENSVLDGCEQRSVFAKMAFFRKSANILYVQRVKMHIFH